MTARNGRPGMDDLISREALKKDLKRTKWLSAPDGSKAVHLLNIAPTVDAAPVVHGRWLRTESIIWCNRCSLCGSQARIMHNYCPNCGARMDLPEGEEEQNDG